MEPIPVDTYNIRLVYLILTTFAEKGILNAHFTEEEARLQEDLIFWVPMVLHQAASLWLFGIHSQTSLLREHLGHTLHAHGFTSDKLSSPNPARLSSSPVHSMGLSPARGPSSLPLVLAWAAIHSLWTLQSSPTLQAVSSHPQI